MLIIFAWCSLLVLLIADTQYLPAHDYLSEEKQPFPNIKAKDFPKLLRSTKHTKGF